LIDHDIVSRFEVSPCPANLGAAPLFLVTS
jgi:hypothetical protein